MSALQVTLRLEPLDSGWRMLALRGADQGALLAAPRLLGRATAGGVSFPVPPEAELPGAPPAARLLADDVSALAQLDARLRTRGALDSDTVLFGQYLFAVLLGPAVWQMLQAEADGRPLELGLDFPHDPGTLGRLPWELARGDGGDVLAFLGGRAGVSFVRLVDSTATLPPTAEELPSVLFAVGTTLGQDVIRPGAEYLGLVRHLHSAQLSAALRSHLLLDASLESLRLAVQAFRPSIVHLICHGRVGGIGGTSIDLLDDDPKAARQRVSRPVTPAELADALNGGSRPSVVVLNACSTATAQPRLDGELALPFAVRLVQEGVPVAVGMSGDSADRACRLFTRRFYEALLQGEDLAEATAEGRRAGICADASAGRTSTDWWMPCLFVSRSVGAPVVRVSEQAVQRARRRQSRAEAHALHLALCDRLVATANYELLLAEPDVQEKLRPRIPPFRVLALSSPHSPPTEERLFGRTVLLDTLAGRAAREGHIPVLVRLPPKHAGWATDFDGLLARIRRAAEDTAARFGVDDVWHPEQIGLLKALSDGLASVTDPELAPPLARALRLDGPTDPRVQAMALTADLQSLRERVLEQDDDETARLLLLVDEVHRLGPACRGLLDHLLGPKGVGEQPWARVVLTYADEPEAGEQDAHDALTEFISKGRVLHCPLGAFDERTLAYNQYLLQWRESATSPVVPLALSPGITPDLREFVLAEIDADVDGVPSWLRKANRVIKSFTNPRNPSKPLVDADDESALQAVRAGALP